MKQIIAGDLATGMQQSVMNFGILMIQGLVNSFGAVVMAGFATAVKIDTLAYFRGINRPQVFLLLTIISLGTRVLLAYALAPNTSLGVVAIWMAIPIGWDLADLVGRVIYRNL